MYPALENSHCPIEAQLSHAGKRRAILCLSIYSHQLQKAIAAVVRYGKELRGRKTVCVVTGRNVSGSRYLSLLNEAVQAWHQKTGLEDLKPGLQGSD